MVFWITLFYNLFHVGNVKSHIRVPQGSFANKLNCVYIWKCFVFGVSGK